MECIFALAAAIIPCLLSSNTKQFSGFTSNLSAAAKKTSGAGFDLYPSLEDTITFGLNTKPACDKNFLPVFRGLHHECLEAILRKS